MLENNQLNCYTKSELKDLVHSFPKVSVKEAKI